MTFDLKKSVQEYTDLTVFGTPKSDIREREGKVVGILNEVLTQSLEVQEAFNQAVCQQTDRVFHGWDYWLRGRNAKAVRQAILHNQPADCSNFQRNRQLTVELLNPVFAKINFGGQYVSSPEVEEVKELYLTGKFKLADDLTYVLDALPDFRTDDAKARFLLTFLIPGKWLAYIGLFGGAFSFGFGTAKTSQAIQKLNHIQDEKQRKEAIRDLARGSSTMLLSLVSMLGASRNFDWSSGKNVTRLPTAADKMPEQPNRAVLPEDKITPIRSEPSPSSLNQKPATDNLYPQVANDNASALGNSSGPNGSPWVGSKGGQSFSNSPVQPLRSVAAGGSGRASMNSAVSQKAEEMCEGAKYSFNGNAALAIKPNPVQTIPIPVSPAPGQCGNEAALPANSPLIFSDYNGEHVSHASLINLKGVEEYLAHLVASFPAVLAVMMSGDSGVNNDPKVGGEDLEDVTIQLIRIALSDNSQRPIQQAQGPLAKAVLAIYDHAFAALKELSADLPPILAISASHNLVSEALEVYNRLSTDHKQKVEVIRQSTERELVDLINSRMIPEMENRTIQKGLLEAPPYQAQQDHRTCAIANFCMIFAGITGIFIPERVIFEAAKEVEGIIIKGTHGARMINPDKLWQMLQNVFTYKFLGMNIDVLNGIFAHWKKGGPNREAYLTVSLSSEVVEGGTHEVVVLGIDEKYVIVHDPSQRVGAANRQIDKKDFIHRWGRTGLSGQIILVEKAPICMEVQGVMK